jgi:hypothetical protein
VPRLLPEEELLAANGLEGTLRPLAEQAAGPALGGLAVAALSPGVAILAGGLTYLFSAGCLLAIRARPAVGQQAPGTASVASVIADLREGFRYVRRTSWLWVTLVFALACVLFIIGPLEVLLPFAIRDNLGGGADDYGLALAAFGIASVFLVAGVAPVLLAVAAILIPRLDRDEIANPLDHPTTHEPEATGHSTESHVR